MKYNERGEVISVNGLTTGHHLGTPMQDALGTKEENSQYYVEKATVTKCKNTLVDNLPKPQGGVASWNDLKDKPFYEELIAGEELLNVKETFTESKPYYWRGDWSYQIDKVGLYKVTYDGVEYLCESVEMNNGYGIGNLALADIDGNHPECWDGSHEDTGEPFAFIDSQYYSPSGCFYASDNGEHTLIIHPMVSEVKKLDEKYMPLLTSPNGTQYKITISNDGKLSTEVVSL